MTDKDQQKLYNLLYKAVKQAKNEGLTLYLVVLSHNSFYIAQTPNHKAVYNYEIIGDNKSGDLNKEADECFNELVFQLSYF